MKEMSNPLVLPRAAWEGDSGGTHWQLVHYRGPWIQTLEWCLEIHRIRFPISAWNNSRIWRWGSHSCKVCEKTARDKMYNIKNARENFRTTPILVATPTIWTTPPKFRLSRPLNIEIYGPKLASILSLCLSHTPICAIELDSRTLLLNQATRDIGPILGLSRPFRDDYVFREYCIHRAWLGQQINVSKTATSPLAHARGIITNRISMRIITGIINRLRDLALGYVERWSATYSYTEPSTVRLNSLLGTSPLYTLACCDLD